MKKMTSLFRKLKRRFSGHHHHEMHKVSPSKSYYLTDWEQTSKFLEMPNGKISFLLIDYILNFNLI